MEEFERAGIGCRVELRSRFIGKRKLTERNELQAVLRTNINAPAAQDAFGPFGFIAFENRVDPALQTARGFAAGLLFREANLDFGNAGAALYVAGLAESTKASATGGSVNGDVATAAL